jgi:hypothetical protein
MRASPSRGLILSTAAIVSIAILLAVLGSAALGRSATPSPTASPTAPPSVSPTAPVTPQPSAPAGDGGLVIEDPDGHVITLDVDDRTGVVRTITSSDPRVGMSVRWGDAIVENIDPSTIRVTWAGFPRDEAVTAVIDREGSAFTIRIDQGMPYPNTDAMGQDRIIVVAFEEPVAAADVAVTIADD